MVQYELVWRPIGISRDAEFRRCIRLHILIGDVLQSDLENRYCRRTMSASECDSGQNVLYCEIVESSLIFGWSIVRFIELFGEILEQLFGESWRYVHPCYRPLNRPYNK